MTLQIIQVGLGGWGSSWAKEVVAQNKDVETTAWVEIDASTLEAARKRLDLPQQRCFTSLEQALKKVPADAVLITASLPGHVPSARAALEAGKHVLMEKPFAPSMQEAKELVELASEQRRILMISQNYRYEPAAQAAAQLVKEQAVGALGTIHLDFRRYDNVKPFEESRHYAIWEPLLADMAIHHFDLMRMVIQQEPVEIYCKTWNSPWSKYLEPAAGTMTITFAGGAVVSYRGSWFSTAPQTNWAGEWHMEGELGEIIWTSRGEKPDEVNLRLLSGKPRAIKLPTLPYLDRQGSLDAFVKAVRSNTEPETSGRDNLQTLALMYAAIESAKSGRPVNVQDFR
jgi:predicted dehydrogenase